MIPRLHLVTDDEILAGESFVSRALAALEEGKEEVVFHLRGPSSSGRFLYTLARALGEPARTLGALLLVNDRVDLALSLDLDGAHLGRRSLPPGVARHLLGEGRMLGLSVHGPKAAREGAAAGVDFLVGGTIFSTRSHPDREPGGLDHLNAMVAATSLPLLAIGGMTPDRIPDVLSAGAHGVAVRGGIWEAADPGAAVRVYLDRLRDLAEP